MANNALAEGQRPRSYDDLQAFSGLVEAHLGAVCAVAYSATGSRAASEDIAQETFLVAWRKREALGAIENVPGWLIGAARVLSKKWRRRDRRDAPSGEPEAGRHVDTSPGALDVLVAREAEAQVWDALRAIPIEYRETL